MVSVPILKKPGAVSMTLSGRYFPSSSACAISSGLMV
jgi:hypothetical protein